MFVTYLESVFRPKGLTPGVHAGQFWSRKIVHSHYELGDPAR